MKFIDIAQANVDFYDNHPNAHAVILTTYAVGAAVVLNRMFKRICNVK